MTKPFPLKTLVHLAQQKNDAATRKLGQLNHHHQSAQSKLDMLQQYRKDYLGKLSDAEKLGMDLQELRNFQDFIHRLDDAIAQQTTTVNQAQTTVHLGRADLTETQRRLRSFETLAQRHVEAESKLVAKQEQKIQDEHSSRRSAYKNSEHSD
jgi:flagellar FliJ protein